LLGRHAKVDIVDGEIVVGGPCVTAGYLSAEIGPRPANGSFATGDLGRLDGNLLTVLGRMDDTIITGGENVQPEEVEAVLRAHPGVLDAAVAGRPDADLGAILVGWLVGEVSIPAIEAWCRDRLAPFKVPRAWHRVAGLPRSESGKLLRKRLPATGQAS
jgi:acyl-CoA synthetase (AMP-forming)/AMP-acid ligase II